MKYITKIKRIHQSVQFVHLCESVIQTSFDVVKAHGGDPDCACRQAGSYRKKIETKEVEGLYLTFKYPSIK